MTKAADIKIPTFEACRIERIQVQTPKDRLDTDAETEARIRNEAAKWFVCWHPEADDSFNISGMGHNREHAYREMLGDLLEYYGNRFDDKEYEALGQLVKMHQDLTVEAAS